MEGTYFFFILNAIVIGGQLLSGTVSPANSEHGTKCKSSEFEYMFLSDVFLWGGGAYSV